MINILCDYVLYSGLELCNVISLAENGKVLISTHGKPQIGMSSLQLKIGDLI
jgi:hypothetical protein